VEAEDADDVAEVAEEKEISLALLSMEDGRLASERRGIVVSMGWSGGGEVAEVLRLLILPLDLEERILLLEPSRL